ncbi:nickel pincer cofactor biosynthesis protein LarC [Clostridium sp. DL1XJH146]
MSILYYDCFAGISGDMNLGAMIDIGVDETYLKNELLKLNNSEEFKLQIRKDSRKGITGTKVDVILLKEKELNKQDNYEKYEKNIYSKNYSHSYNNRNFKDIEDIIINSDLGERVKILSMKIFKKVAEAEAKVHGIPIEEVHSHEVVAVDSIVDIVGAAICIDYLNVDKIISSSVEVGDGFVKCEHGKIPVPAPVTVEILKGIPIKSGGDNYETTTPTGVAILAVVAEEFVDKKEFIIEKIGYGIGTKDNNIPNVLRIFLAKEKAELKRDEILVSECNIDDMNPEHYEYVCNRLFNNGALDVYKTNILMKKERPGILLSVIYEEKDEANIDEILLKHTSTLGIRKRIEKRKKLNREFILVDTEYGVIKFKLAFMDKKLIKYKAEYEDCKKAAIKFDLPIYRVQNRANYAIEKMIEDERIDK